jgi:hypothetical protein
MPPTLSTPVAVVMILSLILGILTQAVQTGAVFGQFLTPKPWLPWLTIAMTFLGGVVAYFQSLSPVVIDASTIFYALAMGVSALLASSAPAVVVHAHFTVPRQIAAWRSADKLKTAA